MAPQGKAHAVNLNLEDIPFPSDVHWHTLTLSDLEKDQAKLGVTDPTPTIQAAREQLIEIFTTAVPGEEDIPEETPEERERFIAGVRAGALDLVDEETFATAIFPCSGEDETACRQSGERIGERIVQLRAISSATCPCPKHSAAHAAIDDQLLTGMYL